MNLFLLASFEQTITQLQITIYEILSLWAKMNQAWNVNLKEIWKLKHEKNIWSVSENAVFIFIEFECPCPDFIYLMRN